MLDRPAPPQAAISCTREAVERTSRAVGESRATSALAPLHCQPTARSRRGIASGTRGRPDQARPFNQSRYRSWTRSKSNGRCKCASGTGASLRSLAVMPVGPHRVP